MPERDSDTIHERFLLTEKNLDDRHDDWLSFYKLYNSVVDQNRYQHRSKLFIPAIFTTIETILPRLVAAITSSNPIISVMPRSANDVVASKVVETLLSYQFRQMHFEKTLVPILRDSLITGNGIGKLMWKKDEVQSGRNEGELRHRGPNLSYVNLFNFFPDPHAKSLDDAQYVMHRYFKSREGLKRWEEQGLVGTNANGESIDAVRTGSRRDDDDGIQQKLKSVGRQRTKDDYTRDFIEVIEYWEKDTVQFLANRDTLIRSEDNPFDHSRYPFHIFGDYVEGDEIYSRGEVENLEDLQHEINTKRNQRIDIRNLIINPVILKSVSSMLSDDEMVMAPGAVWTGGPDDVQTLTLPDTTGPAIEEEQIARQDMKEITSVTDIIRGASTPQTPESATGVNTLDINASSRFNLKIRNFEHPIEDIADQMISMNSQFLLESDVVRIAGVPDERIPNERLVKEGGFKFLEYQPSDLMGNFDFIAQGARSETLRQRQQKLIQVLQIIGPVASEVNVKELMREIMKSFGIKNVDRFLEVPPEQVQRVNQGQGSQRPERGPSQRETQRSGPTNGAESPAERLQQQLGAINQGNPLA